MLTTADNYKLTVHYKYKFSQFKALLAKQHSKLPQLITKANVEITEDATEIKPPFHFISIGC